MIRVDSHCYHDHPDAHQNGRGSPDGRAISEQSFQSHTGDQINERENRHEISDARVVGPGRIATEYFAQGAWQQYGLPYTIVRPFNCVGIGEKRALCDRDIASGNVKLAMSHVVPDLVQKILKGQDPPHILGSGKQVRHYTYGGDLAKGIRLCVERPSASNQDFNLSTPVRTTVLELAEMIWRKIHGSRKPFRYVSDRPYEYDVQERSPATEKAAKLLGFHANTSLNEILDEVIPWIAEQMKVGQI
jgi:UDP-glucose 4-epimerase